MDDPVGAGDAEPNDPWLGRLIDGKYEMVELLGEGGMGAVYRAVHRRIGRKVAVKLLHPIVARSKRAQVRFEGEARAAAATGHPNIVNVLDLGELDDGTVFLVLELLEGRDLGQEIEQTTLSVPRIAHIARQVCSALAAVHAQGIVHRDLKPANIFLTEHLGDRDFVKVLDFGVAKFTRPVEGQPTPQTATGQAIGTPMYMSPEQARGRADVDHRTDIYALGAIVFEALTGRPLFEAPSLPDLFLQICHGEVPRLLDHRPDLPEALSDVVARMVARDAADRFASAEEAADALERFERYDIGEEDTLRARGRLTREVRDAVAARREHRSAADDRAATEEQADRTAPASLESSDSVSTAEIQARTLPSSRWLVPAAGVLAALLAAAGVVVWSTWPTEPPPTGTSDAPASVPDPSEATEPTNAAVAPTRAQVRPPEGEGESGSAPSDGANAELPGGEEAPVELAPVEAAPHHPRRTLGRARHTEDSAASPPSNPEPAEPQPPPVVTAPAEPHRDEQERRPIPVLGD